jgi:ferredoxin
MAIKYYFLLISDHCNGCNTCQDHLNRIRNQEPLPGSVFCRDHNPLLLDDYGGKIQISEHHYQTYRTTLEAMIADCPCQAIHLQPGGA